MKYRYMSALPYTEIIKLIVNEKAKEFWIVFAYFSKNKIIEVLEKLKSRENPAIVHLVLSASSVNPLQDIVQDVLNLSTEEWFDFHLVEEPLMHTKLFAVKFDENIKIYIGSANFTNKAQISNIESGIFFDCCNMSNTVAYLDKLTKTCSRDDSVTLLLSKAVLSHFRSELLFLAIEESKTKQTISIKPEKIKNILSSYSSNDGEEGTVTVKTKNMINIFVLDDNERIKLLEAESALKNSIKENCAIKIEGYGYISSLWSLRKIYHENDIISSHYNDFVEILLEVRKKYKEKKYRIELSQKIKHYILKFIQDNRITITDIESILKQELSFFELSPDKPKSPYKKIELLYNKIVESKDIITLLNPYKIGDDQDHQTLSTDEMDILNVDQINLLVMCQLAIKLRNSPGKSKLPKPPAVWWFDMALDNAIHDIYGFKSISEYKNKTKNILESIKSDIYQGYELAKCIEKFCRVTGFNLGERYPITEQLFIWRDENENPEPISFIYPLNNEYKIYNIELNEKFNIKEIMLFLDKEKLSKKWELNKNGFNCLHLTKGKFVLGNNLRFCANVEKFGEYGFLYINSLYPQ